MASSAATIVKKLNHFNSWIFLGLVFLFPVFFNPFTANLFVLPKNTLLAVAAAILASLWVVKNILAKSFRVTLTPFTIPLLLLTALTLISSWSPVAQFIEAFINYTSAPLFLFIIFLVATTTKTARNYPQRALQAAVGSGVVLALTGILEAISIGPTRWIQTIFPTLPQNSQVFLSPAGSATILLTYLLPALVIALMMAIEHKQIMIKSALFASAAVITSAIIISTFTILPGKPNAPVFAPFSTSWTVAAENIKNPRAFLLGVGPQNYTQAFALNRDVAFNLSEFWNTRFNVARNYPLHIFTTLGVIGFAFWLYLIFNLLRVTRSIAALTPTARIALVAIMVIVITTLIIPANIVLQGVLVFLFAILGLELKHAKSTWVSDLMLKFFALKKVETHSSTNPEEVPANKTELLPIVFGIPVILGSLLLLFGVYRVNAADMLFRRSLQAAAQNNGTETYNFQRDTITTNPFLSSYHRSYANTNLAIANSLSAQGDLSDQDRANIVQLVQQAIREGRSAVLLDPRDPINWETLANIYRQLINVADGAVNWSTSAYTEAIRRDPMNPRLRVELGGIFYQLGDYTSAVRIFEQAVNLKPDWANAHYNLASAYRENGELERSVTAFDNVLRYLEPTSADFNRAVEEQNAVKAQLGQATTEPEVTQTGELQQPAPLPTPLPADQQLQLPAEEVAPPTPEETGDQAENPSGFSEITPATPEPTSQP